MIYLSELLTNYLVGDIETKYDKVAYFYIIYKVLSSILFWFVIFSITLFSKNYYYVVYSLILILFRKYTGGFHLNNADICFIASIMLVLGCVSISDYLASYFNESLYFFLFLISITLWAIIKMAPINHPNMHLNQKEYDALHKRIKEIALYTIIFSIVLCLFNSKCLIYVFSAVHTDLILIIAAKIYKQEAIISES